MRVLRIRFRSKIKYESILIIFTHIVSDVEHIVDNIVLMDKDRLLEQDKWDRLIEKRRIAYGPWIYGEIQDF